MKKIVTSIVFFGLVALFGCRDESLNPLPGWEPGVHGFGVFADVAEPKDGAGSKPHIADNARNFTKTDQDKDAAKVNFKVRWVSLDNKLTVNKIEIVVDMIESYTDTDGNPKTNNVGGGGKVIKTITPAAGNRQWNTFSISPQEVYNAYKDATFKYDKVNAVPVFNNPKNPRLAGAWFNTTDRFVMVWRLYTTDGLVFKTFNSDSICGDPTPYSQASANCQLVWTVR
ncbi:hypothetical protein GCM10023187_10800 [Nibrella viscosa]|uniref:Lipoprotein n=1 Tax=Nibrella viscosa TaxID=1084524 RepID=A0ABP8K2I7_9BACT